MFHVFRSCQLIWQTPSLPLRFHLRRATANYVDYVAYPDDLKTKEHASGNCISISISFYFHLFPVGTLEFPTARLQKFIEKTGTTQHGARQQSTLNESEWFLMFYPCQSKGGVYTD